MRGSFVFIAIIVLVVSCLEPADCIQTRNNLVGVAFKNIETGQTAPQLVDSVNARGVDVRIIAPGNYSKLLLQLDYLNDSTFYTIEIADTAYNLTFVYTSKIGFVSDSCGEKFVLSGLQVAAHDFDSVRLVNRTPGVDENALNLEIFR